MNVGDLFDSPLKIAIIAVVIIVLFGSKKLPSAARSLGQSMRILKKEVQGLHEDDEAPAVPAASQAELAAAAATATAVPQLDRQAQVDALQQQIRDLQRSAAMDPVPAEAARTQQPG
jgi:sec-independent protein translocase protein TatA